MEKMCADLAEHISPPAEQTLALQTIGQKLKWLIAPIGAHKPRAIHGRSAADERSLEAVASRVSLIVLGRNDGSRA
jgi:hypothetical protein